LEVNALNTVYEEFFIWRDAYTKGSKFDIPKKKFNWTTKHTMIPLTAESIFVAVEKGNRDAKTIVDNLMNYLRIGIHNYVNVFPPDIIVIGGGIAKGIKIYLGGLSAISYLKPFKNYTVEMAISELHEHAGILGSAALMEL
jgi:glucokinase